MNIYRQLFSSFFRVGILSFGGGYAMLPILQKEVVENRGWVNEEELADCYAIGQCTPGIIMVNTATYIGYKLKGAVGGVLATLSAILPAFIIILVVASILQNYAEYPVVQNAFSGIQICVFVLLVNTTVKMFKRSVKGTLGFCIYIIVLLGSILLNWSPIIFVLCAAAAGITAVLLGGKKK